MFLIIIDQFQSYLSSKILERLFCNRLENYIEKNKILNDSQNGFRNHRSTAMAILDLIEFVTTALDKKKHVMGIFIDLKKRSIQ